MCSYMSCIFHQDMKAHCQSRILGLKKKKKKIHILVFDAAADLCQSGFRFDYRATLATVNVSSVTAAVGSQYSQ